MMSLTGGPRELPVAIQLELARIASAERAERFAAAVRAGVETGLAFMCALVATWDLSLLFRL